MTEVGVRQAPDVGRRAVWRVVLALFGAALLVTALAPVIGRAALVIPLVLAMVSLVYALVRSVYPAAFVSLLHLPLPFVAVYWSYYLLSLGVS